MKYLQSFRGLTRALLWTCWGVYSAPRPPALFATTYGHCILCLRYNILLHLVRPLGLKHFSTQKIPHPRCQSKKILLCRRKKKIIAPKNFEKKFSINKRLQPPPPPRESNGPSQLELCITF